MKTRTELEVLLLTGTVNQLRKYYGLPPIDGGERLNCIAEDLRAGASISKDLLARELKVS